MPEGTYHLDAVGAEWFRDTAGHWYRRAGPLWRASGIPPDSPRPPAPPAALPPFAVPVTAVAPAPRTHDRAPGRRVWPWVGGVVAAGVVAGVLSALALTTTAGRPSAGRAPVTTSATGGAGATTSTTARVVAHVGTTVDLPGQAVTVLGIVDPGVSADPTAPPDPGSRYVAVRLQITDTGAGPLDANANTNLALTGSDGNPYTFDITPLVGCPNFVGGAYQLAAGQTVAGCVGFQLPDRVGVATVEFSPDQEFSGPGDASWVVG